MAIDYREEALQGAFPNIKKAGLIVRSQVQSEPWVINAKELEELLSKNSPTWWDKNAPYVFVLVYSLAYLLVNYLRR